MIFLLLGSVAFAQNESFVVLSSNSSKNTANLVIESQVNGYDRLFAWRLTDNKVIPLKHIDGFGRQWLLPMSFVDTKIYIFGRCDNVEWHTSIFEIKALVKKNRDDLHILEVISDIVYPNPSMVGNIYIAGLKNDLRITIIELSSGKSYKLRSNGNRIDMTKFPLGNYIVSYEQDGAFHRAKVCIQ